MEKPFQKGSNIKVMAQLLICILLLFKTIDAIKVLESLRSTRENQVILKNSALSHLEDVTICARFNTYQFSMTNTEDLYQQIMSNNKNDSYFQILGSFSAFNCNKNPKFGSECTTYYKGELGEMWRYGATYGNIYLGSGVQEVYFPSWKPKIWKSFCAVLSLSSKLFSLYIDNKLVFHTTNYIDGHKRINNDLTLMNMMKGAMTDVNIWKGIMKTNTMSDWMNCKSAVGGDLLNWRNASIELVGTVSVLEIIDIGEICQTHEEENKIIAFEEKKNYEDGKHFCGKVGEISVARSEDIFQKMVATVSGLEGFEIKERFYVGYTDIEIEGIWVDENSGENITYNRWDREEGFPSNWHPKADCAAAWKSLPEAKWFDGACYREFYPVCKMKNFPERFQLRGVSMASYIDTHYVWVSTSEFLGFISTKLLHNAATKKWEILSSFDNELLAHTIEEFDGIPLGTFEWSYDKSNLSAAFFNFHLAVDQPGYFCCDDGLCLSSELVCDNIPNCRDKSDERNCDMVKMPDYQYEKIRPPSQIIKVNNKKVFSFVDVFATFTILDVLEINDAGSFFDVFFKLGLQWRDLHLKFEFLKDNPSMNALNDSIADKIWVPKINFFHPAGSHIDFGNKKFIEKGDAKAMMTKDVDKLIPREIYQGKDTVINYVMKKRMQFSCAFENVIHYPFGSQICKIHFFIEGTSNSLTNFKPKEIINLGPTMLGQYFIQNWRIDEDTISGTEEKMITASVTLSRHFLSVFMVTYLPTILMNIINQTINYISGSTKESLLDLFLLITNINNTCLV